MSTQQAVLYLVLANTAVGFVIGLVPLAVGFIKGNRKYAFYGLIACTAGGAILRFFLALPLARVFIWLIFRESKPVRGSDGLRPIYRVLTYSRYYGLLYPRNCSGKPKGAYRCRLSHRPVLDHRRRGNAGRPRPDRFNTVIDGITSVGDDTHIFPFVSIGLAPQDLKYAGEPTATEIGKRNHIREFVTIIAERPAAAA